MPTTVDSEARDLALRCVAPLALWHLALSGVALLFRQSVALGLATRDDIRIRGRTSS